MPDRLIGGAPLDMQALHDDLEDELGTLYDRAPAVLTSVAGTNTIIASTSPATPAYVPGQSFWLTPVGTNTGAVTLNIDTLGAVSIRRQSGDALSPGDLVSGQPYQLLYDGSVFKVTSGALGAGSPKLEFIGAFEIANGASELIVPDLGNYRILEIDYDVQVQANARVDIRLGDDLGDTTDTYRFGYVGVNFTDAAVGEPRNRGNENNQFWPLGQFNDVSSLPWGAVGRMHIHRFNQSARTMMYGHRFFFSSTDSRWHMLTVGGGIEATTAYSRFRLAPNAGNFGPGLVLVSGYRG